MEMRPHVPCIVYQSCLGWRKPCALGSQRLFKSGFEVALTWANKPHGRAGELEIALIRTTLPQALIQFPSSIALLGIGAKGRGLAAFFC